MSEEINTNDDINIKQTSFPFSEFENASFKKTYKLSILRIITKNV